MRNARAEDKAKREWDEVKNPLTPQQIIDMKASSHANRVRAMIEDNKAKTWEDAIDARDYLMYRISCENSCRAGPLAEVCRNICYSEYF